MKSLSNIVAEQKDEVATLRSIATTKVQEICIPNDYIIGVLLTGSVARGDARIAPLGIFIDMTIVAINKDDINLEELFGKDEMPFIPKHCVNVDDKIGIAYDVTTLNELQTIRSQPESNIFARHESRILFDRNGSLANWKHESFKLSPSDISGRALACYFRFDYLTNEYRMEKWSHRQSYIQINQNFNEACENYCSFVMVINSSFIPRKDWLAYLSYEMPIKPEYHAEMLEVMYIAGSNDAAIDQRQKGMQRAAAWMKKYCEDRGWL